MLNPEIFVILLFAACQWLHNCDWYCAVRGLGCIAVLLNDVACRVEEALRYSSIWDFFGWEILTDSQ